MGERNAATAHAFLEDLVSRLANRVQLTSDGLKFYLTAVESASGADIDFAQFGKIYDKPENAGPEWYRPPQIIAVVPTGVSRNPDLSRVCTSQVERANLSVTMHLRRFTRLTNAFSKKVEKHLAALAVYFMYYTFARIHQSLRVTPAQQVGVTDRAWAVADIGALLPKPVARKRGPYKKRRISG